MKIAIESKIPFINGIFEAAGHEVTYLSPEEFTANSVKNFEALVIRTRTKCDESLLKDSKVKKIATATIGTDHIDLDYCKSRGIDIYNAPGCNAPAVAQYVLSSISTLGKKGKLGIVGVGNVGSIVNRWAQYNDIETLLCDPPLGKPYSLEQLTEEADIITFHTPLDASTFHLADAKFFASLKRKPLIINAARGPVIDTNALIDAIKQGHVCGAVIDCWEEEPNINNELLNLAQITTPHIAGYSIEGKRRATAMAVCAIDPSIDLHIDSITEFASLTKICATYNPLKDSALLKAQPNKFETLRNNYDYRQEP